MKITGPNEEISSVEVATWCLEKLHATVRKVDEPVNLAQQMIGGDVPLQAEAVKQRFLHHPPFAHHPPKISCSQEK